MGKPYAVKAGAYDGSDAYLDWHPLNATASTWNTKPPPDRRLLLHESSRQSRSAMSLIPHKNMCASS